MAAPRFALWCWAMVVITWSACATYAEREVIGAETELGTQLGFIREPACRRELVEARLGVPPSTFEKDRIVS